MRFNFVLHKFIRRLCSACTEHMYECIGKLRKYKGKSLYFPGIITAAIKSSGLTEKNLQNVMTTQTVDGYALIL